ncbi:MAG: precorrin-6A/cobalt-precorrin-6A reductase, partial [Devosiaceae bacterium]|nr:precorrin-6A/cobalt-precorrin-6A reductase [Devosiaceae bacterium]
FSRSDLHFLVRSIEPICEELPANFKAFEGRPPFSRPDEIALLKRKGITHLVSKNSGGEQTKAKLDAAFILRVQVVMISRPPLPPTREVNSVDELKEVFDQLPLSTGRSFFLPLLRKIWAKLRS